MKEFSPFPFVVDQPAHPDGIAPVGDAAQLVNALRELSEAVGSTAPIPYAFVVHPDDAAGCMVDRLAMMSALASALREAGAGAIVCSQDRLITPRRCLDCPIPRECYCGDPEGYVCRSCSNACPEGNDFLDSAYILKALSDATKEVTK